MSDGARMNILFFAMVLAGTVLTWAWPHMLWFVEQLSSNPGEITLAATAVAQPLCNGMAIAVMVVGLLIGLWANSATSEANPA